MKKRLSRSKPLKRGKPPRRGKRPRVREADPLGDYRAMVKFLTPIWSRIIRARSRLCVICRVRPVTCAAHVFPKGHYPHIRFDLDCGVPLCTPCHVRFDSDHEWGTYHRVRLLGEEKYEALRLRGLSNAKTDLSLVRIQLEAEAKKEGIL